MGLMQSRAVLGWEGWREAASQLGIGPMEGGIRAAAEARELETGVLTWGDIDRWRPPVAVLHQKAIAGAGDLVLEEDMVDVHELRDGRTVHQTLWRDCSAAFEALGLSGDGR